jgi:hypothetical protein
MIALRVYLACLKCAGYPPKPLSLSRIALSATLFSGLVGTALGTLLRTLGFVASLTSAERLIGLISLVAMLVAIGVLIVITGLLAILSSNLASAVFGHFVSWCSLGLHLEILYSAGLVVPGSVTSYALMPGVLTLIICACASPLTLLSGCMFYVRKRVLAWTRRSGISRCCLNCAYPVVDAVDRCPECGVQRGFVNPYGIAAVVSRVRLAHIAGLVSVSIFGSVMFELLGLAT